MHKEQRKNKNGSVVVDEFLQLSRTFLKTYLNVFSYIYEPLSAIWNLSASENSDDFSEPVQLHSLTIEFTVHIICVLKI